MAVRRGPPGMPSLAADSAGSATWTAEGQEMRRPSVGHTRAGIELLQDWLSYRATRDFAGTLGELQIYLFAIQRRRRCKRGGSGGTAQRRQGRTHLVDFQSQRKLSNIPYKTNTNTHIHIHKPLILIPKSKSQPNLTSISSTTPHPTLPPIPSCPQIINWQYCYKKTLASKINEIYTPNIRGM